MKTTPHTESATHKVRRFLEAAIPQLILMVYTVIALFPIFMIVMNSFKAKKYIFGSPFALPTPTTFDLIGYETVIERSNFRHYFLQQPDRHLHVFDF